MDRHLPIVGEFEPDDLQQESGRIRADREYTRRVSIWVEIDDDDRVINCVQDGVDTDAMFER